MALTSPGFEVHLPALSGVPDMLERQAEACRDCRNYVEDVYSAMDLGPGPMRNAAAGVINYLAGSHNRIREEVQDYFEEVRQFAAEQAGQVAESVRLYRETEERILAMLDASIYQPERRRHVQELGRSHALDLDRPMVNRREPRDAVDSLKPVPDYGASYPFAPEWIGVGRARDTIWEITWIAHQLGLMSRPVDIVADVLDPLTGDWAGLKACGEALENLAWAGRDLHANIGWIEQRIDAVWHGNAADACWFQVRRLQKSLVQVPSVLEGYARAYEEVVDRVRSLQEQVVRVLAEALDWGIAALFGYGGLGVKGVGLLLPPSGLIEAVKLVFELIDLVKAAANAVWDFNTRCELGLLASPSTAVPLPPVPDGTNRPQ